MSDTDCTRQLDLFEVGRQQVTVDFEGGSVPKHLSHACPADAQIASECRPGFKLAGVEKGLIITSETEGIAGRFLRPVLVRTNRMRGVPCLKRDDWCST